MLPIKKRFYTYNFNIMQINIMLTSIMFICIIINMLFLNRTTELTRLNRISEQEESSFVVIWGRRRIGKTRLLLEWLQSQNSVYWVADESAATVQRRYFSLALEQQLPGFAQIEYPDWGILFERLAKEVMTIGWRGPLVMDEFPYLVTTSPELPSILQRFIDHLAPPAKLIVAICGSSQRLMQGLVLDAKEPLYGRAKEIIKLAPIDPAYLKEALKLTDPKDIVKAYSVWGGIPRYWELAAPYGKNLLEAVEALALDPQGILHDEPPRLLLEEAPPATALRPILDVIGLGVHRLSEIAGRLGQPATSLARPLERLRELQFIEKEIPFGIPEVVIKRALYKIKDPFLRFWYGAVAKKRSVLTQVGKQARLLWLQDTLPTLINQTWEELCRTAISHLSTKLDNIIFEPAQRFWHGNGPEWDVVAKAFSKKILLVGEAKWTEKVPSVAFLQEVLSQLIAKGTPYPITEDMTVYYILFIPEKPKVKMQWPKNVYIFDAEDVIFHTPHIF